MKFAGVQPQETSIIFTLICISLLNFQQTTKYLKLARITTSHQDQENIKMDISGYLHRVATSVDQREWGYKSIRSVTSKQICWLFFYIKYNFNTQMNIQHCQILR